MSDTKMSIAHRQSSNIDLSGCESLTSSARLNLV